MRSLLLWNIPPVLGDAEFQALLDTSSVEMVKVEQNLDNQVAYQKSAWPKSFGSCLLLSEEVLESEMSSLPLHLKSNMTSPPVLLL